jgi:hypothetical protein
MIYFLIINLVFVASPLSMQYYGERKSKDWLAQDFNQDNVSEWDNMSIRGLLFQ